IDPDADRGFELWKCTSGLKRQPLQKFPLLRSDGTWANKDDEIAKEFTDSLEERFMPFDLVTDEETAITENFDDLPSGPASQISPIDAEEFKDQIKRLKTNKAPGHDSIDGKVAKALPVAAISFLTRIFNAMIVLSYYPEQWKHANVVMIPKKGSASRPILAGVPQGSVLGPVLYTIFTSDLPSPRGRNVLTATYADDTAFLATSALRREATDMVQDMLNEFEAWASRWNIAVNPAKFQHA
ncbi:hypothetical protein KR084_010323, partial [Drosophila pseudotakahashii]